MRFDWNTKLVDLSGRDVVDEHGNTIALGTLVVQALLTQGKDDIDGAEKFSRFRVASCVAANADIDVTDAALIKEVCGNVLTPLPVGRIWELLEKPLT